MFASVASVGLRPPADCLIETEMNAKAAIAWNSFAKFSA